MKLVRYLKPRFLGELGLCVALMATVSLAGINPALSGEKEFDRRHVLGTSLFMLANFLPAPESPEFAILEYGYELTPKDVLMIQAITWKYNEPLGLPKGRRIDYPGTVRSFGGGLAYQRFLWKRSYVKFEAIHFLVRYSDTDERKIQDGYQLYLQLRPGYHFDFSLLGANFYLEPSVAFIMWPINTNRPSSFAEAEDRYTKFFPFEPGLNLGVSF